MVSNIIVKAKVKEVAKGFNVASDVSEALDRKVNQLIVEACERAKANKRTTLMGKDIGTPMMTLRAQKINRICPRNYRNESITEISLEIQMVLSLLPKAKILNLRSEQRFSTYS